MPECGAIDAGVQECSAFAGFYASAGDLMSTEGSLEPKQSFQALQKRKFEEQPSDLPRSDAKHPRASSPSPAPEVKTSMILGTALPRKPRIGPNYQATIPPLVIRGAKESAAPSEKQEPIDQGNTGAGPAFGEAGVAN